MDVHHFKSLIVLSRRFFLKTLTLRRLKSGQDRISVRMIRKIAIGITPALTKLFNPSIQTVSSLYTMQVFKYCMYIPIPPKGSKK